LPFGIKSSVRQSSTEEFATKEEEEVKREREKVETDENDEMAS